MFAVSTLGRSAMATARFTASRRGTAAWGDIIASPPTYRISFAEKTVHGLLLCVGVLAYPVYTMFEVGAVKREEYAALEVPEKWQAWRERQKK